MTFLVVICTDIKIVTESWGSEISWTFGNCTSNQVYESRQIYTEECCQLEGDYRLLCKDSYGDGWNGGYIEINGTQYCTYSDFETGHEHEVIDVAMPGIYVFEYFKTICSYNHCESTHKIPNLFGFSGTPVQPTEAPTEAPPQTGK